MSCFTRISCLALNVALVALIFHHEYAQLDILRVGVYCPQLQPLCPKNRAFDLDSIALVCSQLHRDKMLRILVALANPLESSGGTLSWAELPTPLTWLGWTGRFFPLAIKVASLNQLERNVVYSRTSLPAFRDDMNAQKGFRASRSCTGTLFIYSILPTSDKWNYSSSSTLSS